MVSVVVGWSLLPPLLVDTIVVRKLAKGYLERQLGRRVEVGRMRASSWRGVLDLEIETLDVYDRATDAFVAYCEKIELRIKPWWWFVGRSVMEPVRVRAVDIELPSLALQRLMMARGYWTKPVWDEPVAGLRRTWGFRDIEGRARTTHEGWLIDVRGRCGHGEIEDGTFELMCTHDERQGETRIEVFTMAGTRVVEKHYWDGREMRGVVLRAPLRVKVLGVAQREELALSHVEVVLGGCRVTGRLNITPRNLSMSANVAGRELASLALLSPELGVSSRVERIEGRITSKSELHSGRLVTEGAFKWDLLEVRGVVLRDGSVSFEMVNDRVTALNAAAAVFDGMVAVDVLESLSDGERRSVAGQLAARRIDLNACLSLLGRLPATAGGELNGRVAFRIPNVGVGEFLRQKVGEFVEVEGEGHVVLSNAYLTYFAGQAWQSAPGIPEVIKHFLGVGAVLSEAVRGIKLVDRLVQPGRYDGPRAIRAQVVVKRGGVSTPEIIAETPIGEISGEGECSRDGALRYRVKIKMKEELSERFAEHPVLSQFYRDGVLVVPVSISGTIGQPRVRLDLSEGERRELEDRLIALVTEYVSRQLGAGTSGEAMRVGATNTMVQVEEAVRDIMRRLF